MVLAASASNPLPSLLMACSVAVACAVLSVFVVSRRWAFIGEGISHSGLGGAGTAWLLALAFPALDQPWLPYSGVVVFSLGTALAIGYFSRRQRINSDAAIGIFMVASLAWGILAQYIYFTLKNRQPPGWNQFVLGEMSAPSMEFGVAAALACLAVVVVVAMLGKEIIYYCFDPALAAASGVRAGFVHYLLMLLVAITIVIGVRVAGALLVTALLILPGTTALILSDRLRFTMATAIVTGLLGAICGLAVRARWPFMPMGPAIVLALFLLFLLAYVWVAVRKNPRLRLHQPAENPEVRA